MQRGRQSIVFGFIVLGLLLSTWIWPWSVAKAQSGDPVCTELEVVILVDQSGSMGGAPIDHPIPNDPHGLRFFAPLHVIRWMGADYLGASKLRLPSRPVITYRIAVVDFGDAAQLRLPWTTIAPASDQDWNNLERELAQKVGPFEGNLGNTNIVAAFQMAKDLFSQRADVQDGCPRRAIFLLSDGMPYVPPPEGSVGFSAVRHMQNVQKLVQGPLKNMNVEVWVTAINDSNDNYWPRMRPYWEDILSESIFGTEPHALKVNTEDEIGERFTKLLVELADRDVERVRIGPRCVAPYLQKIIFTFYKQDPEKEHLEIYDPVGRLTPARTDVKVEVKGYDEPIEYLIVDRPLPGKWDIKTTAPRADVIIEEVTTPAVGQMSLVSEQNNVQYTRNGIFLRLTDSNNNPLPEYTDQEFDLILESELMTGQDASALNFVETGVQEYKADFIPLDSGLHRVIVTARSKQPVEKEIEENADCQWTPFVLDKLNKAEVGQFDVAPVGLIQVGQPEKVGGAAASCPLQAGDEVTLTLQVERLDLNQPVTLTLPVEWEARLESPSGSRDVQVEGPDATTGQWRMIAAFDEGGDHTLSAVAQVRTPDGSLHELGQVQQSFQVAAVQPISAEIRLLETANPPWWETFLERLSLAPKEANRQIGTTPMLRATPMQVQVTLTTDGQTPVDPSAVLVGDQGRAPVALTLADEHGVDIQTVSLIPTNTPGRYLATIEDLPLGAYELRAALAQGLTAACGFALTAPGVLEVERVQNPWIYFELLALAVFLGVALLLLRRHRCQTRNACQGFLTILDKDGRMVDGWYKDLSGRNVWRLREPVLAEKCQIQEIRVHCTAGSCGREPYPDNGIRVEIILLSITDKHAPPLTQTLRPRGEPWSPNQLGGYRVKYALSEKELRQTR